MKKVSILTKTPVPKMFGLLFLLWASAFVGLLYLVYNIETSAQEISLESRYGDVAR